MTAKKITQSADSASSISHKVMFDIKNLEKRLAELIERDHASAKLSFGFIVLTCVAHGQYDRAMTELELVGQGLEEYVEFERRARRFIEHAKGLVAAIRTKHNVGNSPHVNKAKQKELSDRIAEHFVDLKKTIIVIEKIQKSVRSEDLSSTIFFFRACFYAIATVFVFYTLYLNLAQSTEYSFRDIFALFSFEIPF